MKKIFAGIITATYFMILTGVAMPAVMNNDKISVFAMILIVFAFGVSSACALFLYIRYLLNEEK